MLVCLQELSTWVNVGNEHLRRLPGRLYYVVCLRYNDFLLLLAPSTSGFISHHHRTLPFGRTTTLIFSTPRDEFEFSFEMPQ